jgi:hypothetical protein
VVRFGGDKAKADAVYEGCEPLTPDDIAEVVVFAAGRRENVVLADSLIFPNHQVSMRHLLLLPLCCILANLCLLIRLQQRSCTKNPKSALADKDQGEAYTFSFTPD